MGGRPNGSIKMYVKGQNGTDTMAHKHSLVVQKIKPKRNEKKLPPLSVVGLATFCLGFEVGGCLMRCFLPILDSIRTALVVNCKLLFFVVVQERSSRKAEEMALAAVEMDTTTSTSGSPSLGRACRLMIAASGQQSSIELSTR